ncbi:hypothetical protein [Oceanicoccus sagamiensis]|uniref:hypothetical protein n=1 Tax=Oceanicoccus sagamiensis TaxID=716816 RepID=UPI0012F50856|nr:hypothetical protein [Oceanicoccus sagamiensis]
MGNTDAVLDALALGFGIDVNRIDQQLVYLSSGNSTKPEKTRKLPEKKQAAKK